MEKLISIIIPTYNRAELLGRTLDSILSQTYANWECIIVDDCSKDYTFELLQLYCAKDSRFKYFNRPKSITKGANACRNYGFSLSKGEYINWFDSDDLMLPEFLEKKICKINNSKKVCSICSFYSFSFEKGEVLVGQKYFLNEKNIFENICLKTNPLPTNGPMWKRTFLENKSLFNEHLTISQDLEFFSRILPGDTGVAVINKPLFLLRRGHENITSELYKKIEKHFQSYFVVRKNILQQHPKNLKIKQYYKQELLDVFRFLLGKKKYSNCEEILDFLKTECKNISFFYRLQLIKIHILFFGIKMTGRGETKFKKYLKF